MKGYKDILNILPMQLINYEFGVKVLMMFSQHICCGWAFNSSSATNKPDVFDISLQVSCSFFVPFPDFCSELSKTCIKTKLLYVYRQKREIFMLNCNTVCLSNFEVSNCLVFGFTTSHSSATQQHLFFFFRDLTVL